MRLLIICAALAAAAAVGYSLGWSDYGDEIERRRQEREAMA